MAAAPKAAKSLKSVLSAEQTTALDKFRPDVPEDKWDSFETTTARLLRGSEDHKRRLWYHGRRLTRAKKLFKERPRFLVYLDELAHISEMSANNYSALYAAWPEQADFHDAVNKLEAEGQNSMRDIYARARQVINKRDGKKPQDRYRFDGPLRALRGFVEAFRPKTVWETDPDDVPELRARLGAARKAIDTALESLPSAPIKKPASKARRRPKAA